jgi:hypothetical protein
MKKFYVSVVMVLIATMIASCGAAPATPTAVPPTSIPPTAVLPTATAVPPTATAVPPTATPIPVIPETLASLDWAVMDGAKVDDALAADKSFVDELASFERLENHSDAAAWTLPTSTKWEDVKTFYVPKLEALGWSNADVIYPETADVKSMTYIEPGSGAAVSVGYIPSNSYLFLLLGKYGIATDFKEIGLPPMKGAVDSENDQKPELTKTVADTAKTRLFSDGYTWKMWSLPDGTTWEAVKTFYVPQLQALGWKDPDLWVNDDPDATLLTYTDATLKLVYIAYMPKASELFVMSGTKLKVPELGRYSDAAELNEKDSALAEQIVSSYVGSFKNIRLALTEQQAYSVPVDVTLDQVDEVYGNMIKASTWEPEASYISDLSKRPDILSIIQKFPDLNGDPQMVTYAQGISGAGSAADDVTIDDAKLDGRMFAFLYIPCKEYNIVIAISVTAYGTIKN